MEKYDLIKILRGDIEHINYVNQNDPALFETKVVVNPEDVKNMLLKFLEKKVNKDELNQWASFICIRVEYTSPNTEKLESDPDYYEDIFYVLQCLSTPEIDGEINEDSVKNYLTELEKYFKKS